MKRIISLCAVLLVACAGTPPPAWQRDGYEYLNAYRTSKLAGNEMLAARDFAKGLASIGKSGKLEAYNHAILYKCAIDQAAFSDCRDLDKLRRDYLTAAQVHYQYFLAAQLDRIDANAVPAQYRALLRILRQHGDVPDALQDIDEPLSRLIAATVALKLNPDDPRILAIADRTASDQGWPAPLRIVLGKLQRHYRQAGDSAALNRIEARMQLLELSSNAPSPSAGQDAK